MLEKSYGDQSWENPKRQPWESAFHPMIPWVYSNHYSILILHQVFLWANTKEKTGYKMYHGDSTIGHKVRFWWPVFDSNFRIVNIIFGWNQLYQIFLIFVNEMSKYFWNYLWQHWYMNKMLSPGQQYRFRAQLYLTKVSPIVVEL